MLERERERERERKRERESESRQNTRIAKPQTTHIQILKFHRVREKPYIAT